MHNANPLARALIACLLSLVAAACSADKPSPAPHDWPYPEDTPQKTPLNIGMAGDMPVDISRFLLARGASAASLSPDGEMIAFRSQVTGRRQLWVMSARGGQETQLTFGNGITFFTWHPDSQSLLYGADNDGDEKEAYYLISRDGRQERIVLEKSSAYRRFGDFDQDGKRFSYASTERTGRDFDIYVHDMNKGSSEMVFEAEFGFYPAPFQPGANRMLMSETRGEDAQNLYLLDLDSKEVTTLYKPKVAAAYESIRWNKDGSGFYFVSNQDGEMMALQYYDVGSGAHQTLMSGDHDYQQVRLCNNDEFLLWATNEGGFSKLHSMRIGTGEAVTLELGTGVLSFHCGARSDTVVVGLSGPKTPGTLSVLSLISGESAVVRQPSMAGIRPAALVTPELVSFPARDGVTLHGLLYMPKSSGDIRPPIVIDIHGGPTAQARPRWEPLAQYLVGKGIAVMDINVRGSTGYGKAFMRLDNREKRLDSVRDLVDALAWLKQDGRVNADKAAAMGGSYGGYMVNAVMGAYPDAFTAGASFVGVADWVRALKTASPGLKASDRIEYGDIREQQWQDFYRDNSPINTVDKIKAPMFFEHGVNDPRDPVTESDVMVKALRKRGIDVTYLRFPDEGHSVAKLDNRVGFYRALAAFLEKHLAE